MVEFTTNYNLAKLDFNDAPWHDDMNGNMDVLDSVLFALTGIGNVKGVWKNSTSYTAGDRVVDDADGTLWRCAVSHTSATSPTTFSADRAANPTYWEALSITFGAATTWATSTAYTVNDFVVDGARYGVVVNNYTSGASYNADVTAGNIITLIDLSTYVPNSAFTAADRILYSTGVGVYTTAAITSFGRSLVDDANAAAARITLELGSLATLSSINNDNWSGTDLAVANGGTGASDAATARDNLGLGSAAVKNTGTSGDTVPLLNAANTWSAVQTFGDVRVGAGSAAAPSIAFSAEVGTGFWHNNLDIRVSINGSHVHHFSGTGFHSGAAKTVADPNVVGTSVQTDGNFISCASNQQVIIVNRQGTDGVIMSIRHANVEEGSISSSGTTISYNAFLGSHWSQFADGHREEIPIGTICDSIEQMCHWPQDRGQVNDRLPCFKISDNDASKAVYGVFIGWDDDEDETNDAYIAALGAGWVRIQAGETVQIGDLICSAGNGCGRVQEDDIMHSYTVAKITSTEVVETYSDGSYRVPATLHCG